jgi:hypothetical protein
MARLNRLCPVGIPQHIVQREIIVRFVLMAMKIRRLMRN